MGAARFNKRTIIYKTILPGTMVMSFPFRGMNVGPRALWGK